MRVLCSPEIVACANEVMQKTTETYLGPDRSVQELVKAGVEIDPLKRFSEMARDERYAEVHCGAG